MGSSLSKQALTGLLGLSRSALYYAPKQPAKDWSLKCRIEVVLREHPSYGHRRLALALSVNRKRALRVMRLFSIHPYRRRGRKPHKKAARTTQTYPNLLLVVCPAYPNHVWVADFTHLAWHGRWLYLATVMDLFTRRIVGWALLTNHAVSLTLHALFSALLHEPRPAIFHSDNGSEYGAAVFTRVLVEIGTKISRSRPGCPWENGYQESFYAQFKVDLGDPNRFDSLGELVAEVHQTIHTYNHTRIHTALRMPPVVFADQQRFRLLEKVSYVWGT